MTRGFYPIRPAFLLMMLVVMAGFSSAVMAQSAPVIEDDKPLLNIQRVESKGGLSAWLVEDHSVPVIAVGFGFKGAGAVQDPQDLQGRARILSNTLDEGAGNLDSQAFQNALRDHSISLSYGASRDDFTGALKTLTRHKDTAFDLLRLSLTQPRFDDEAITRMVAANVSRIQSSLAQPEWLAARIMNDVAYDGHPYAHNSGGTLSTLARITPDILRDYHAKALAQDNLYVSVVGDISAEELGALLDQTFGGLPKAADLKQIDPLVLPADAQLTLYKKDIPQTVISMMQPGIARDDPAYHTAQVMNFILGSSGFGSRLTRVIREEAGLTYGIYTNLVQMDHSNGLTLETSTRNESVNDMLGLIALEWHRMASQPITQEELDNAKSYLIGSLPLSFTSTDGIASILLNLQMEGLPIDYLDVRENAIEAVTVEDVSALSQRLLDSNAMQTVLVGMPENIDADRIVEDIPNVR